MTPRERIAAMLAFLALAAGMLVQSIAATHRHDDVVSMLMRIEVKNDNYHSDMQVED